MKTTKTNMKSNLLKTAAVVCGLLLLFAVDSFCSPLILNGGLELTPPDGFRTVLPGQSYAGWYSVGPGDVEFCGPASLGPAIQGQGVVDLNGVAYQGGISQTLGTSSGTIYNVHFALSGNPGRPFEPKFQPKTMDVFWNGNLAGSFVFSQLPTDTQQNLRWEYHDLTLFGNGGDVLTFASTTADKDSGPLLDDITVAVVPEPSVLALLSAGGLVLLRRFSRPKLQPQVESHG